MMYLLPLLLMFVTAALARIANSGELVEIIAGLSGLVAGFYFVKSRLKNKNTGVQVKTIEDFK